MELFDKSGQRKYITPEERKIFERTADNAGKEEGTFALMLLHSGCRISEALNLKYTSIDFSAQSVTFETLKKRKKGVFRQVPLPPEFLRRLDDIFKVKEIQKDPKRKQENIWQFSRATASRRMDELFEQSSLSGIHACPKGLRHGFAIACLNKGIQLNMVKKWMGHSSLAVTEIYANAVGEEEINIISKLWED